jgi:type II secretory pathway pseudopilin PulG
MNPKATFLALTAAVLAWAYGSNAQASNATGATATVLASQSDLLQESGSTSVELVVPGPGALILTLTDLQFPTSFSTLQYAVTDSIGTVLPLTTVTGPNSTGNISTTTFQMTAPDTLYANVFATVGQGGAGLFNLTATFVSAVPLPGSLGLFAGGGLFLILLGRGKPLLARRPPGSHQPAA